MSLRGRRFAWVFARAAIFFGLLLGLAAGGLTATLLSVTVPSIHEWPFWQLVPALMAGTGLPLGVLVAYADAQITSKTPMERLDPAGSVRQRITLEVPVPPDAALEAVSRAVFEDLEWTIEDRAEGHLTLRVPRSFRSFGEQVSIDLHPTPDGCAALIFSRPLSTVVIVDYNKNRENVYRLRDALIEKLGRVPPPAP